MREIGLGVIGWGFMGKTHAHALREMPLFYPGEDFVPVLQSICSRRLESAREAARLCGFAHFTDDYRETLAREDVEAVSICTPNARHLQMALSALAAGKHVYIDKPLAMNEDEALQIAQAVRLSGKKLQVAHNNRYFPSVLRAKQLMEEGRLGRVLSFRLGYLHSGSVDPARPAGWKQLAEGGALLDLGTHALDIMQWLLGGAEEVLCESKVLYPWRPGAGGESVRIVAEDQAVALIKLKCGALGTFECSKIATGTEDELSFEIYAERGALRWRSMEADYLEFFDGDRPEAPLGGERGFTRIASVARYPGPAGAFLPPKNRIGWDRGHMHCYHQFLDAIVHDGPTSPDVDEAVALHRLIDALKQSRDERRWVSV